jgi:hypothetical protein
MSVNTYAASLEAINMPNGTKTQAHTESADDRRAFCAEKFKWLNALNADKDVDGRPFKVAFAVSQYLDVETGETCRLSDPTIAAKTGLPERCVRRARVVLRDHGWLSWRRTLDGSFYRPALSQISEAQPAAPKAQRRRAPSYRPPAAGTTPPPKPQHRPPAAGTDRPRAAGTSLLSPLEKNIGRKKDSSPPQLDLLANGQPAEKAPIQPKARSQRSSKKESSAPTRFAEFWQVYPRKDDKKAAEAAYARAVRKGDVTEGELIAGAERYAAERAAENPVYTKYATTWLNGECWGNPSAPKPPVNGFNGSRSGPHGSYNDGILMGLAKVAGVQQ